MPGGTLAGQPRADLILRGFSEIATLEGPSPRRGPAMENLSRVERGALASDHGRITWVGPERSLPRAVTRRSRCRELSFEGCVALPGLVDAHTHAIFAGSRADELRPKVQGMSYAEIARGGGGLFQTVRETRKASRGRLLAESAARLARMRDWGTTTVEVKSGYALETAGELRLLELLPLLARRVRMNLVPTFLGAHAFPPGVRGGHEAYLRTLTERMIPEVARRRLARFCDVFCDPGFFSRAQARRVLRAGLAHGLAPKIHADELANLGGSRLAAELPAVSADHLLRSDARDREALARAGVIGVVLPTTPFASLLPTRSPGRELVDAGVAVALGSDLSPNSWVESYPQVISHAVYSARLTPAEALSAATVNAAAALRLGESAGQLAPGRPLDLAVFPLARVEEIPYRFGTSPPVAVFRAGERVDGNGRFS